MSNLFSMNEAAASAVDIIRHRMSGDDQDGFVFPLPELQRHIRPILPGEPAVIIGLSGHGKSTLAKMMLYQHTKRIYELGPDNNRQCTVLVSWEEPAEIVAMNLFSAITSIPANKMLRGDISKEQFSEIDRISTIKVGTHPIYIIGESIKRDSDGVRRQSDLTMRAVEKSLNRLMNDDGREIKMIVEDYAQLVPDEVGLKRDIHMMNVAHWMKGLGTWAGCPTVAVSQAKQELTKAEHPIPGRYDAEWSAAFGQAFSFVFGVYMPKTKYMGATITSWHGYQNVRVTPSLMFMSVPKQKYDKDGMVFALDVDFSNFSMFMADCYQNHYLNTDGRQNGQSGQVPMSLKPTTRTPALIDQIP